MAHSEHRHLIGTRRAALLLSCLLATAARGQSLDYDKLESLFGEPVTISATGKPERVSDTPATMDIITQDDIKRSGARDLATLLRLLPGMTTYRGYNGTEPFSMGAVLLNGREIYLASFGQNFLDSLPVELEEIRQIEVVRGPQSGFYGFNSTDGVINIITFDPARDDLDFVRLRGGNDARRDGAAAVTLNPADGVGVRLTAATDHEHAEGFATPRGMSVTPENQDRRSFNALFSAILPDGSQATVEASHSDLTTELTVPEATLLLNARLQDDAVKADYTAETAIGRIGALVSYTSLTVPEASTYLNSGVNLHDHTTDGRLNDLVKLSPDDSVRGEFEARFETAHTAASAEPVSTLMLTGYGMWDHRFSDSLSMVNAVRYFTADVAQTGARLPSGDFHYRPHAVADNSSVIYKIGSDDTVRASFARGVSLPSQLNFSQLGLTSATARGFSLAAGPAINTWSNTEERVTYDHQFRDWGATGRISLFHQQSDDIISLMPFQILASALPTCHPPTLRTAVTCQALTAGTGLSGTAPGMEVELEDKSPTGLTWGANYSLEVLRPHGTPPSLELVPGLSGRETLQKANAHLGYGWGAWSADMRLLYTSPGQALVLDTLAAVPHAALESSRAVVSLSPRLGWQATDFAMVELSAENLWPYRLNALQKVDSTYYLTLKLTY